jgi:hypothetical protein
MNEMTAMNAMNAMTDAVSTITFPPFIFHYIIVVICVVFLVSVCVLKFKYLYWYSQPITFWFTFGRWFRGGGGGGIGGGCKNTNIMNPLSLVQQYRKATVYPFLHFVNHDSVIVYKDGGAGVGAGAGAGAGTPPYQDIAQFLSRRETELVTPGQCEDERIHIRGDIFELMYNLSAFIGVFSGGATGIKGVCVLAPRIMLSFSSVKTDPPRSVTIYLCEHLSWAKYITSERESLELLETTEYIQKSREIAGEQTLYKYHEIPWFVIPFTTVYRYTFSGSVAAGAGAAAVTTIGAGVTLIKVSSVNFALFYTFVNECARDFRYCIFHELTQLQSLVQSGVYSIYMLLLHQVRVLAVYIFAPSWMKVSPAHTSATSSTSTTTTKLKRTRGNRISSLHDHISRTSTALVKYLPPVTRPTYDAFGKRIKYTAANGDGGGGGSVDRDRDRDAPDILLLKSSIRHKTLCDHGVFVRGFIAAVTAAATTTSTHTVVCIDTIAHNYQIIDALVSPSPPSSSSPSPFTCISQDKWYYILYNAIIHEETVCKYILMV